MVHMQDLPFPAVTLCQQRPGLERLGFVEEALNWVDPQDPAVNETLARAAAYTAKNFLPAEAAFVSGRTGVGTRLVALMAFDDYSYTLEKPKRYNRALQEAIKVG